MNVNVLMGLPCSGKSTFAHNVEWNGDEGITGGMPLNDPVEIINPDNIRFALTGDAGDQTQNKQVFDLAHNRLRWLMVHNSRSKTQIVFDATNVKKFARENLLDICYEYGVKPTLIVVDTPLDVCLERMQKREQIKQQLAMADGERWGDPNRIVVVPNHAMQRMSLEFIVAKGEVESEGWERIDTIPDGCPDFDEYGHAEIGTSSLRAVWS
jgi:predicted kinase